MADAPNTLTTLDGFFKRLYADKLGKIIPSQFKVQADIGFSQSEKLGDDYQQTVETRLEHGVTYADEADDAFNLAEATAGATKPARIKGSQLVLKAQMGYKSAYAGQAGERAFGNATGSRVRNMWQSSHKRLEIELLYGQSEDGIATCTTGTTTTSIVVSAATFAPGIWAGSVGMWVLAFDTAGTGPGVAPLVTDFRAEASQVTAVNLDTRTITIAPAITGLVSGDVIFIGNDTAVAQNDNTGQTNNVTTSAFNSALGIDAMARMTSGTLWNIAVGDLWAANEVAVGSADLSFGIVQDGDARGVAKGKDGDSVLYCAPITWGNLMTDQGALRRYDSSQNSSRYQVGAKDIEFYTQSGKVSIKAHPFVKQGKAYQIVPEQWMRIGATDVTFNRANMGGAVSREESYLLELATKAGFEVRCYSDQAPFTELPGHVLAYTGIVNS